MLKKNRRAFITIDVLVAGVILTAGIASSMYLFRVGLNGLERANTSNLIAMKLCQVPNLLKVLDLNSGSGKEDLGDGVTMEWSSKLLSRIRLQTEVVEGSLPSRYEVSLYEVTITLLYRDLRKTEVLNVFKSKSLASEL